MATNGMVALKSKDGSVRCSYVRSNFSASDGKKILYKYYLNADRVNDLLDFGTINSVRPYLSPYFADSVETYVYRDNDGDWVEDNTNVEYGSFEEFMDAAYRDYYISNSVFSIMLFDEETNEWYIVNEETRKIVPFENHYLGRFDDTLEELEEYHAFVESLLPPEALKVLDAHGRQFGTYMHQEFDRRTYYQVNMLLSLEHSIEKAKENGNVLQKNIVVDLDDEDELKTYHDIFQGRSRKPEIMDFVVEQMSEMSFEEIQERIVRDGLKAPEKQETTQVSSNSLEKANIYLKVVEMIGNKNREPKIRFLPITKELENMTISEIPALLGIENATVEIYHDQKDKNASYAILSTWLPFAEEVTVKKYAIFSLMESIENHASMIRTMKISRNFVDERRKQEILAELAEKENLALKALRTVMDEATLKVAAERIREIRNLVEIYDLIDELGIMETEPNKGPKK